MSTQTETVKGAKMKKKQAPPPQAELVAKESVPNLPIEGNANANLSEWGVPNMTSKDILIPKIFAMQAMSKAVTEGKAKFGEFRDSLNQSLLGDCQTPVEFVPFFMEKVFVVFREVNGTFKFHRNAPITSHNESMEFEQVAETGEKEKWYRTMNFYVLFPKDIKSREAIPYVISFRSTSARAGQKLATTMFMKNLKAGKTPAAMVMELSGQKTSNDKGTFVQMDVKEVRPSSQEEIAEAFTWVKTVMAGRVKVDHSDLESETAQASRSVTVDDDGPSDF